MKTKELIRQLQEADPSGELEVNCGLEDIFYVDRSPYFYDGCSELLIRDPNSKYYNVIGAKFVAPDDKISIKTHSIYDALWENPELPVEYNNYTIKYKDSIEKARREVREGIAEVDKWHEEYKKKHEPGTNS